MVPSRLAFLQEFEQALGSPSLQMWFDGLRLRDSTLHDFADPVALRQFLHSREVDARKPEVWRALVRGVQGYRSSQATLFVLGLLEPALGTLVDGFDGRHLDADDLWQEAIRGALRALRNPRQPERNAVLAGLVLDTLKHVCAWIRIELSKGEEETPLFGLTYETNFDEVLDGVYGEALLAEWCHRAAISSDDSALIFATRVAGLRLSQFARAQSRLYYRLWERRQAAESRLRSWLTRGRTQSGETANHSWQDPDISD
jgi:hypothetical protein